MIDLDDVGAENHKIACITMRNSAGDSSNDTKETQRHGKGFSKVSPILVRPILREVN